MTRIGFHCSHEQIPPRELLACGAPRRAGGLRGRDVLRPLLALERAPGRVRLCLVVPGRRAGGHEPAVRSRQRARAALPPRDHRPGGCFPVPDVPRAACGSRWAAAKRRTSTSRASAGRPRPSATRACASASRSSGRCSPARSSTTTAASWSTAPGCGPCRPSRPPLIGPAVSVETAAWVGEWADGLVTVNQPPDKLERMIAAFRENGGEGKRARRAGPPVLGAQTRTARSRSPTTSGARTCSRRRCAGTSRRSSSSTSPRSTCAPRPCATPCWSRPTSARHVDVLRELAELGFDEIYLHHVGREQERFIDAFGEHVLPELRRLTCASTTRATCGGRTRSSTASTSRPSSTPTATASATSRA